MGSSNIFTNTLDAIAGTDTSGQKKKAKRKEREMQKQIEAQQKEQQKEKEKQQKTTQSFYESMRQGNLGLLAFTCVSNQSHKFLIYVTNKKYSFIFSCLKNCYKKTRLINSLCC